jgi:hypothetical protein
MLQRQEVRCRSQFLQCGCERKLIAHGSPPAPFGAPESHEDGQCCSFTLRNLGTVVIGLSNSISDRCSDYSWMCLKVSPTAVTSPSSNPGLPLGKISLAEAFLNFFAQCICVLPPPRKVQDISFRLHICA